MWAYSYAAGKCREDHLIGLDTLRYLRLSLFCVLFWVAWEKGINRWRVMGKVNEIIIIM